MVEVARTPLNLRPGEWQFAEPVSMFPALMYAPPWARDAGALAASVAPRASRGTAIARA
jgi:hypothetical protein